MLTPRVRRWGKGLAMLCALLCADTGLAQSEAPAIRALRTAPSEKFTVNAGVRDWGPSTITGQTVLAGGPTGSGGLFAINPVEIQDRDGCVFDFAESEDVPT